MVRYLHHIAITFYILRAITGSDIYLLIATCVGMLLFLLQLQMSFKIEKVVFYLIVIVSLSYVLTLMNSGLSIGKLFIPLFVANIAIARSIVTHGISFKYAQTLFYGAAIYFIIASLLGYSANDVFAYSRNHVSVFFINSAALLYIASYQRNNNEKHFLPVILVWVFSIMSQGIGGILSSTILLYLVYYYYFASENNNFLLKLIFVSGFIYILTFMFGNYVINFLTENAILRDDLIVKLNSYEARTLSPRSEIWGEYFDKLSWQRALTGIDLNESFYGYTNLHNSYLLMHARMGFLAVMLIFVFVYALFRLYKFDFILFTFYIAILIRGVTDTTLMSGSSFDFVLFTLVIISFVNQNKIKLDSDEL
jgi:hypothetical protein